VPLLMPAGGPTPKSHSTRCKKKDLFHARVRISHICDRLQSSKLIIDGFDGGTDPCCVGGVYLALSAIPQLFPTMAIPFLLLELCGASAYLASECAASELWMIFSRIT